jgi:hypothetical protein
MFEYAQELNGGAVHPRRYFIPDATAVSKGEVVAFTPGTGIVAVDSDNDDPVLGVVAATKPANGGTEAFVYDSPNAVFRLKPRSLLTATGGSTTTFVVSTLQPQTDDIWIGGYLEIVSCAADPSLVGKRILITDSTGSTGTLTFAAQKAAFGAGDTAYLCPGPRAIGSYGWDLVADADDIDWTSSGGEALELVGVEPEKFITYWKFRLHQLGNDAAAK